MRQSRGRSCAAKAEHFDALYGLEFVEVSSEHMSGVVAITDKVRQPYGLVHGGVLASLCDHLLGTVCYPVIPPGAWAATTEFKLNYLAPVTAGSLSAAAQIVSLTKRTAVVRIEVDNDGRQVCLAQGTVLVMPPKA